MSAALLAKRWMWKFSSKTELLPSTVRAVV